MRGGGLLRKGECFASCGADWRRRRGRRGGSGDGG